MEGSKPTQIGQQGGMSTQILSGLAEGELVVTHPDETIENGVRARLSGLAAMEIEAAPRSRKRVREKLTHP